MNSKVSITSKIVASCLFALASMTCAAETTVIEIDLPAPGAVEEAAGYIVQAASVEAAARAVASVGGEVTDEINTMNAVGAMLLPAQVELLKRRSDVRRIIDDRTAEALSAAYISGIVSAK